MGKRSNPPTRVANSSEQTRGKVDLELITRNFPEGVGTLEMLCIYEVANGLIQKVSFVMGEKRLG